ncbi:MAG: class I SAM-dependent methyltransferase, partial [Candidatus Omnitrophica bacterium]|nr:class I SAM-dependent methyltransferase [Candidatus Omnitrophota bacterium]
MAISLAMFGLTTGGVIVYFFGNHILKIGVKQIIALSALLFAASIAGTFITNFRIPFESYNTLSGLYIIFLKYIILSLPFIFAGICLCLNLTKFPEQISKLYCIDLLGAAGGCIGIVVILNIIDGLSAITLIASLACLAALFFASETRLKLIRFFSFIILSLFIGLTATNIMLIKKQLSPILKIEWAKGRMEPDYLWEKWNSFSRVTVKGNLIEPKEPFGWGLSPAFNLKENKIRSLTLGIDSAAGSNMVFFNGNNIQKLDFLKYDVVNLAHYFKKDADILVIGSGGGRDILSALVFSQKHVLGIEVNKDINAAVNGVFGEFTGHLDRNPKVEFIVDEARSFIARTHKKFDIIQLSLVDTWAATNAGAFILSENALYTSEAWRIFLNHLNPQGILTVSRWYLKENPLEMYRIASLAYEALLKNGTIEPKEQIIIARRMREKQNTKHPDGVGTILIKNGPFLKEEVAMIKGLAEKMHFEIVFDPFGSKDSNFSYLLSKSSHKAFLDGFPFNISAPTDNSPFFFQMLKLKNIFKKESFPGGRTSHNNEAMYYLGILQIIALILSIVFIILPMIIRNRAVEFKKTWAFFLVFFAIGTAFMLIEISQIQRFSIFLGHPIYSLSVVLFTLLISCGIGSYSTNKIEKKSIKKAGVIRLALLILILVILGVLTPEILVFFQSYPTVTRIIISAGIISVLGFFMGMAF